MRIATQIQLELDKIELVENPINKKGIFVSYVFKMKYPSEYYFFQKPKIGNDDFTIFWGNSPTIVFYQKDYKSIKRQIESLIKGDLPDGFKLPDIQHWHVNIANYSSPINDREWALFYKAETYYDKFRVKRFCSKQIGLSKDFMSRLIAELPTQFTNQEIKVL